MRANTFNNNYNNNFIENRKMLTVFKLKKEFEQNQLRQPVST